MGKGKRLKGEKGSQLRRRRRPRLTSTPAASSSTCWPIDAGMSGWHLISCAGEPGCDCGVAVALLLANTKA